MAATETDLPFIKNLASSDRHIRTQALTSLEHFLSSRTASLTPTDALKLWTGLFYALWMADRPLTQQHLCDALAGLLFVLPSTSGGVPSSSSSSTPAAEIATVDIWLGAFWATMAREWARLDVYRLEKFMLLVRRVLGVSFLWMRGATSTDAGQERRYEWNGERVDAVVGLLAAWPFNAAEEVELSPYQSEAGLWAEGGSGAGLLPKAIPVGLKLHVLDIWVDEAEKVGLLDAEVGTREYELLQSVNGVVDKLAAETTSTALRIRSKEALADNRLPWNAEKTAEGDDDSWDGIED